MFADKINVKQISYNELRNILENTIYREYNCEDFSYIFKSSYIFRLDGNKFSQILYSSVDFKDIIEKLEYINLFPYSIGIPILKIKKSKVYPLLPLGEIMVIHCKNKLYLPEALGMKLIYGKSIRINEKVNFMKGIGVINGKFIAFITVKSLGKNTLIIPDLDIGWYLRKGG